MHIYRDILSINRRKTQFGQRLIRTFFNNIVSQYRIKVENWKMITSQAAIIHSKALIIDFLRHISLHQLKNPPASLLILFQHMDPRPYNYQFRRPRPNNPTYQSYNAYDSLYHMGKKDYFNTNNILRDEYSQRMNLYSPNLPNPYHRNSPPEVPKERTERQSVRYDEIGVNTDNKTARTNSNYSSRSRQSVSSNPNNAPYSGRTSVLSNYGSSSLDKKDIAPVTMRKEETNIVFPHNSTSDIFIKQQRPFNIINMYSKHSEPLRKFPKLTKEHLLYEQGMNLITQ